MTKTNTGTALTTALVATAVVVATAGGALAQQAGVDYSGFTSVVDFSDSKTQIVKIGVAIGAVLVVSMTVGWILSRLRTR